MGISPIANLNPLAVRQPAQTGMEPLPMARVENSGEAGNDSYSPGGGGSAGGGEDSEADSERDGMEVGAAAHASEKSLGSRISLFACGK